MPAILMRPCVVLPAMHARALARLNQKGSNRDFFVFKTSTSAQDLRLVHLIAASSRLIQDEQDLADERRDTNN